jgi:DNA-directed RNA polymerase
MKTQVEIEQENLEIIIQKTMNDISKAADSKNVSDLKQVNNIMPYYVSELADKLEVYQHTLLNGSAKVKPIPAKALTLVSIPLVAHYTVKTIINHIGSKMSTAMQIYTAIAKQLELEVSLAKLKVDDNKAHNFMVSYLKSSGHRGARLVKLSDDLMAKYHREVLARDLSHVFMQVAQVAVTLLAECQPIVEGVVAPPLIHTTTVTKDAKSKAVLIPADWVMEWLRQQTLDGNLLPSYHTALVEPPIPWTGLRQGGFHTEHFKNHFIKTEVDPKLFNWERMHRTVTAVNTLQETPWEINKEVLEVMMHAFRERTGWGSLACPQEIVATPYPYPNMKRKDMTPEQLKITLDWVSHKERLHDEYASETSRYLQLNRVLNEAQRFSEYTAIYFAYQCDFRGRLYPIAANLHPQGSEYVKSLLRFAVGKPITSSTALEYFAAHGANAYGKDKINRDKKFQWVKENERDIILSAQSPIHHSFWRQADEPWTFLAFCFEWAARLKDSTHPCKLPIALDGSCNGLQHLSAMLRDEVGGREVNLTDNFNKRDIYQTVADKCMERLAGDDSELAKKVVQFGIKRSTAKRPVMIMPYAGTQSSCREYVHQDFLERGGREFFASDFKLAVSLVSSIVWESIGGVVIKGRDVMQWFKKCARLSAKYSADPVIHWVTPNGFQVYQKRVLQKDILYQTVLGEAVKLRVSMRLKVDTDAVDLAGHSTAVSPNFIHSLDACALQETVLMADELGIHSFAMIHDSYATHAEDTPQFADILRQAFVIMYQENDVLQQWVDCQPPQAQLEFPERPSNGKLDLNDVLMSEHFFA